MNRLACWILRSSFLCICQRAVRAAIDSAHARLRIIIIKFVSMLAAMPLRLVMLSFGLMQVFIIPNARPKGFTIACSAVELPSSAYRLALIVCLFLGWSGSL